MSVRAYRIIKIERAESCTFNLWHDTAILDFLEDENDSSVSSCINENGSGQFEFSVKSLKKLLKQKDIKLEDWHIEAIKADIAFAKEVGDDYVLYDSF